MDGAFGRKGQEEVKRKEKKKKVAKGASPQLPLFIIHFSDNVLFCI